ncbi:MAG: helix-turn-helix domain-containing protein [Lachnospiraceae bacterium]|nr:helix-turn-helix domain-containing protein [Lachnospiraceae bacterium]MCD8124021.1 helix-turn-helix domain-containing protein [Lachnospiraceae bacterium]MCD8329899.1 helix-turn-helix domain-containing protein [Lachnospiraceae bacterium]
MNYPYLGKRIQEERKNLHLTQAQLAEASGIQTSYIGLIERGKRNASLHTIIQIANALHVTVDYLLQDYVEGSDDAATRRILQLLQSRNNEEKDMICRLLTVVLDYLDGTQPRQ